MAELDLGRTTITDLDNVQDDFSVDLAQTDGVGDQKETEYVNFNWSQQLGYYKKIPELKADIDALARWTVGKGYDADRFTKFRLSLIRGIGNESFNTILENMVRTSKIGGDSYAEIIRNLDGMIVNLKPLDAGVMRVVANKKGIIIRYEQLAKTKGREVLHKFNPIEIFHLSRNRTADEIHGESLIDAVENIILMRNEALDDWKTVLHRNVVPVRIIEVDTDDETKINRIKTQYEQAIKNKEVIIIPKETVSFASDTVAPNATMNPIPWIQYLTQFFHQVTGVPSIITGGSNELTEATAKILYLAYEQTISEEQLYTMEQVAMQLGETIGLKFPKSLMNEILGAEAKSETPQASTPEDTSVTNVGVGNGT